MNKIETFIKQLCDDQIIVDKFTKGYCWHFAQILLSTFGGELYYDPIMNHFAARVNCKLYDANGMIKNESDYMPYKDYEEIEPIGAERLKHYCILKDFEG